ncbi:PREDICTED: filamin-interacting protein FAM101B [Gavialis gangeticus]|uniref:filamin-interacting protein FAM101B n=1 Tax=Gavialis gangeticus TaxID=94835 RepID=UPI00092E76BD|nr:PREDICTED: filamin-interacting protein FAM101B [Gavialis gangeticus]
MHDVLTNKAAHMSPNWLQGELLNSTLLSVTQTGTAQESPVFSPGPLLSGGPPRLCPLSFGEGVELDPVPPKEVRYTSSVTYDSEKHFIDDIYMPVGLGLSACSQTVICVPDCTWRSYKSEVRFEPRNKPLRFSSTTIVYPKHTKTVFTTTLDYNCRKAMRRFLSSVELESSECAGSDCLLDGC